MIRIKLLAFAFLIVVMMWIVPTLADVSEPNTLISVHITEVNNKNKPVKRTYRDTYTDYRLVNYETGKKKAISQNRKAELLYLQPGTYCLYSTGYANFHILKIPNSVCFRIEDEGITNVGTWVIGIRASPPHMYALLIDMKENYEELESYVGVTDSTPAVMSLPTP